jgi:hypothetical protein
LFHGNNNSWEMFHESGNENVKKEWIEWFVTYHPQQKNNQHLEWDY